MPGGRSAVAQVVQPVLDHAAAERARLVNEVRAGLLESGGAVTIEMIAEATGRSRAAVRQWVTRQRNAGALVTVTHDGVVLVPTFQLDDAFGIDADAAAVVVRLADHGMSGWAIWDWFTTPNTWLDGAAPQRVLAAGDSDAVHAAVSGLFQE
jgi:biotin operon repressor